MILIRSSKERASTQAHKLLDKSSWMWDNMITINKRITHDIRRKKILPSVTNSIRCFGREAQEPARLRLWDDPAAARAGRPVGRGAGMHHQLARSLKLRDLYAIAAGPDGRGASGVRARRTGARVPQEEVQGSGLTPHTIFGNTRATPREDAARVVEPGFRQGRRRARSAIKCQRSAGPV